MLPCATRNVCLRLQPDGRPGTAAPDLKCSGHMHPMITEAALYTQVCGRVYLWLSSWLVVLVGGYIGGLRGAVRLAVRLDCEWTDAGVEDLGWWHSGRWGCGCTARCCTCMDEHA